MTSIKKELWNIFTHYSLHGNPRDPSKLTSVAFHKLCRDIMIFDPTMTERPMSTADINLIYTSEFQTKLALNPNAEKSDKLTFDEFLTCLVSIARRCYPSFTTNESAMRQLLLDNVLPMARRRTPVSIKPILNSPPVASLFAYYEDALLTMFKFYSYTSDSKGRGRPVNTTGKTFDEQKELIKEARAATSQMNSMANSLSHADFLRFTNDYGLLNGFNLTHIDLGEMYLSIIAFNNFTSTVRYAEFNEFWEAFVRIAIVAFRYSSAPVEIKIKALFSYIWKYLQSAILDSQSSVSQVQGFNTYKAGLIGASQVLNEKFLLAWTKDNYTDYLASYGSKKEATKGPEVNKDSIISERDENLAFLKELADDLDLNDVGGGHGNQSLEKQVAEMDETDISHVDALELHLTQLSNASSLSSSSSIPLSSSSSNNSSSSGGGGSGGGNNVILETAIDDKADFEDSRITPQLLRQLIAKNPQVGRVLYKALVSEGIL